jgi:hypothetical protein
MKTVLVIGCAGTLPQNCVMLCDNVHASADFSRWRIALVNQNDPEYNKHSYLAYSRVAGGENRVSLCTVRYSATEPESTTGVFLRAKPFRQQFTTRR